MNNLTKLNISIKKDKTVLALGAESVGNFSIYKNGAIYYSENFGDLLDENNFIKFKKAVLYFLKNEKIKPAIILTDLHPEMKTTIWGSQLAKKNKSKHIQIQHHHAHIFSQLQADDLKLSDAVGVALDGTGYGLDTKIWGGEVFVISNFQFVISKQIQKTNNEKDVLEKKFNAQCLLNKQANKLQVSRIGHLENQTMIGGDLAIREPARMLIGILSKINPNSTPPNSPALTPILRSMGIVDKNNLNKSDFRKNLAYHFVKKYYSKNQFELLYNQLQQNFNCQKTSSTGRILDATAVLLGFAKNERKYKHQASDLLKKNSTKPYLNLRARIIKISSPTTKQNSKFILDTTYLFEYLIKNLHRDKRRLAATAQFYIAQGMYEIIKKHKTYNKKSKTKIPHTILSGGISENKIISNYFQSKGILINKKSVVARGDAGLSYGQIVCYFLSGFST